MSYEKQTWVDGVTPLDAEHLNHIEDGIVSNENELKNKQPKGNYLTEHQKIKTINGQSLAGEGDVVVGGITADAKALLLSILRETVYTSDQRESLARLEELFSVDMETPTDPDDEPGDPGDEPVGVVQNGSVLAITSGVSVSQTGSKLSIH